MKHLVIVIEPAIEGEDLSVSQQIHDVFGPFDTEVAAMNWISQFQEVGNESRFQFHITDLRGTESPLNWMKANDGN